MGVWAGDSGGRRMWQAEEEELQSETCNAGAAFAESVVGI